MQQAPNNSFKPSPLRGLDATSAVSQRAGLIQALGAMGKKIVRPDVELLWLSTVDQGRQLELNSHINGLSYPLATVVADEGDESLWLELYIDDIVVQIPLATVQEALAAAPGEVHSEAWYEANGYYSSDGLSPAAKALAKRGDADGT